MSVRPKRLIGATILYVILASTLALVLATPALGFGTAVVEGHATDAVSHVGLRGIQVDVWSSVGYHLDTLFTDASGHYTWGEGFVDPSVVVRVTFSDPSKVYGPQAWGGGVNMLQGADIALVDGDHKTADGALQKGVTFRATVTRTGHPYTKLPGIYVDYTWDAYPINAFWTGYTSAAGINVLSGGAPGVWSFDGVDPTGRFDEAFSTTSGQTFLAGSVSAIPIEMPVVDPSQDVVLSVPFAKSPQKAGNAFSVTGTLSKRVTRPKTVTILAIKGGTHKTFGAKITAKATSSTYKASVKLKKGTWTLVALFGGNQTLAPTDSGTGSTVKVK